MSPLVVSNSPPYTIEEVVENFTVLLEQLDFSREIEILGIRKYRFRQRKRALLELRALSIALWRLTLRRSFPDDGELIFETFMTQIHSPEPDTKHYHHDTFDRLVRGYAGLLELRGQQDFTVVSDHLITLFSPKKQDIPAIRLRLALVFRSTYTTIFNGLV